MSDKPMKRAVVTGATSFIGIGLVNRLLSNGYAVIGVVRPGSSNLYRLPRNNKLKVIQLGLDNIHSLPHLVTEKVDLFFHLAWEGARDCRDDKELHDKNYHFSMDAVRAASKMHSRVFIGAGSQAEYGQFDGRVDEEYRVEPLNEYGKAKLKTYREGYSLALSLNQNFIWTRIFSVYGEYDHPSTLISTCIKKMLKNDDIPLSQCTQKWDYLYVDDAADALCKIGETGRNGEVYNIASGVSKPLKEYVLEMQKLTNSQSNLLFGAVSYGKGGPVSFEPVVDKLKNDTGWFARTDFAAGVTRIIEIFKDDEL